MSAESYVPYRFSGGKSAPTVASRLVRASDGIAKYRLANGQKMYAPIVLVDGRPRAARVGFPTRTMALEYRAAIERRYLRLLAAAAKARHKSRWFRLLNWLANFLNGLTTKIVGRLNRWHPK